MINLHLLTRISGNDAEFRTYFISALKRQVSAVIAKLDDYAEEGNWSPAFLLLDHYSGLIPPYSQPGYFSELQRNIAKIPTLSNNTSRLLAVRVCIQKLSVLTQPKELYGAVSMNAF
jgi:hypothetical protein